MMRLFFTMVLVMSVVSTANAYTVKWKGTRKLGAVMVRVQPGADCTFVGAPGVWGLDTANNQDIRTVMAAASPFGWKRNTVLWVCEGLITDFTVAETVGPKQQRRSRKRVRLYP